MIIESFTQDVRNRRGKSGGWPADLTYVATERDDHIEVTVSNANSAKADFWKRMDPWGFAFYDEVWNRANGKPLRLKFSVPPSESQPYKFQYEALKRRLSYLAHTNDMQNKMTLLKGSAEDRLYSLQELSNRPSREVIHPGFRDRSDTDEPGRLEKDFQAYLFGKGRNANSDGKGRVNERLALFGEDFLRVRKAGYKIEREFPTGAFESEVKEANRILPTEFVDLVTLNRKEELAVIEIKLDDPKLEVISQVLNYALFFHSYRPKLATLLKERLDCALEAKLVTYLVSNTFHQKFDRVWSYYTAGPLTMKQIFLGYMPGSSK